MTTLEDIAQACEHRRDTYLFLSRLFRKEVDAGLLAELKAKHLPYGTGSDLIDRGYMEMAKYLSNTGPNTLTELAVDFVRTFVGHGNDSYSCAYPYESVYTSPERLLMMGARDEVLAIYRSQGLDKAAEWKESEDHLSLELEFLADMADRTAKALREGDEKKATADLEVQHNFLTDHIVSWLPMMTKDMHIWSKTGLYQGLADVSEGYTEADKEFLDELLADDENAA